MTTATLTVTRTSTVPPAAALDITATPFRMGSPEQTIDFGTVTWRREHARSPYIHGAQPVGAVKDLVEGCTLDVDVTGADQAAVRTNVSTLLAAFSQFTFTLTATLDGTTWAWTCQQADYSVGPLDEANIYGLICPVRLVFPRQPVPVTGPY